MTLEYRKILTGVLAFLLVIGLGGMSFQIASAKDGSDDTVGMYDDNDSEEDESDEDEDEDSDEDEDEDSDEAEVEIETEEEHGVITEKVTFKNLTDEQRATLTNLRAAGDMQAVIAQLAEYGISLTGERATMMKRIDKRAEIEQAIAAGNYATYMKLVAGTPLESMMTESVFQTLSQAYQLRKAGNYEGARALLQGIKSEVPAMPRKGFFWFLKNDRRDVRPVPITATPRRVLDTGIDVDDASDDSSDDNDDSGMSDDDSEGDSDDNLSVLPVREKVKPRGFFQWLFGR